MPGTAAIRTAQPTALLPATVVTDAAGGDRVAFARLVAAYHADPVRVAYVVSGDEQLARDAAQSAWVLLAGCGGSAASGGPGGSGSDVRPTGLREVRDVVHAKALTAGAEDLTLDVCAPTGVGPFPIPPRSPGRSGSATSWSA